VLIIQVAVVVRQGVPITLVLLDVPNGVAVVEVASLVLRKLVAQVLVQYMVAVVAVLVVV
jgi:hypothetical protein